MSKLQVTLLADLTSERRRSMDRYADDLFQALTALDQDEVRLHRHAESKDITTYPFNKIQNYQRRFVAYPRSVRMIHADVLHIIDQSYAHLARARGSAAAVVTCHDLMLLTQQTWAGRSSFRPARFVFQYSAGFLREADHIIVSSEATRNDVLERGYARAEHMSIIPVGLAPEIARVAATPKVRDRPVIAQAPDRTFQILHVGTNTGYKNIPVVLSVIARLRSSGLSVRLVKIGDPFDRVQQRQIQLLRLEDAIDHLGFVSEQGLIDAYLHADMLLYPSLKEGFGWPVIEALALGTPVVASTDPSIMSNTLSRALYADARDVDALADLSARLLTEPGHARKQRALGIELLDRYDWSRIAQQVTDVYRSVS